MITRFEDSLPESGIKYWQVYYCQICFVRLFVLPRCIWYFAFIGQHPVESQKFGVEGREQPAWKHCQLCWNQWCCGSKPLVQKDAHLFLFFSVFKLIQTFKIIRMSVKQLAKHKQHKTILKVMRKETHWHGCDWQIIV